MASSTEPKLPKVPGESTTNPSFASPNIQTAPDVQTSQKIAGLTPTPNQSQTPNASQSISQPTNVPSTPSAESVVNTPKPPQAETTNQGVASTPGTPAPLPQQPTPTVPTTSGAPPGIPNTAVMPIPAQAPPKALEGHNASQNELITAQNQQQQELYEAALKFNGGPDSALEQDKLTAEDSLKSATSNRGAAGTIESSLYQGDKGTIANAQADANLKAYNVYQEETNRANAAMEKAEAAFQRATEQERREIAEASERRETQQQSASVKSGYTTPNVPGGTVTRVGGAPGAGGVVPREYKTPGGGLVRIGMPRGK